MKNYNTSLYIAALENNSKITISEARDSAWKYLKQFAEKQGLVISKENDRFGKEKQEITYKSTNLCFRLLDLTSERLYFLSFQPSGDVKYWGRNANESATNNVLEFCNLLGANFSISLKGLSTFQRKQLSSQDRIDISDWEVNCRFAKPPVKAPLGQFMMQAQATKYENIFNSIPKGNQFHVFSENYAKGIEPFPSLRNSLSQFGTVLGPDDLLTAKEFSETLATSVKERSAFVFLENVKALEQYYSKLKIFFDSNRIPTQYISDETVQTKLGRLAGVRANLILELLTKMGKQPVALQAPAEIFINDGFLYLSDIINPSQRLFGALFSYSKQGLVEVKEEVQIYDDIKFETPTKHSIELDGDNIGLLSQKIHKLIGRKLKIDILLTKRWKQENIENLVAELKKNLIEINKVYYISSKTSRYVDDYLLEPNNYRSLSHPYMIINGKIAFLKACTETRIFPNLFSLYVELVWPTQGQLGQGDLEKILWLGKKRIYRVQEFYILKNLEPIYIFRNLRKMYLGDIKEKLTIPLRLLI